MKKWIILIIGLAILLLLTRLPSPISSRHKFNPTTASSTQGPVEEPTAPLPVQAEDVSISPTPNLSLPPPLLDIKSTDYPRGTVVSAPITPNDLWDWNVSYTCSEPVAITRTTAGNLLKTGPNLVVELLKYVPTSQALQQANVYKLVQTHDSQGTYSVQELVDNTYYFRVSGNCDWRLIATEGRDPLYNLIEPCTPSEQSSTGEVPLACGR